MVEWTVDPFRSVDGPRGVLQIHAPAGPVQPPSQGLGGEEGQLGVGHHVGHGQDGEQKHHPAHHPRRVHDTEMVGVAQDRQQSSISKV